MKRLAGPLFLFLAFFLAGTSVISARILSGRLGPFTITALSLLLALAFLMPVSIRALLPALRKLQPGAWLSLGLQALFGIFLFRLLLIAGLRLTTAGEAGIMTGATPAVTAILAMAVLKEPPGVRKLLGILSTVSGILLIQGLLSGGVPLIHLGGNLLILCAGASEAVFNIISRASAARVREVRPGGPEDMPPLVQTTAVVVLALLFSLLPAALENPFGRLAAVGWAGGLALLWYGLGATALGYLCWYAGIKRSGAFTAAAFSGMMPFTSMVLSVLLLGEAAGWPQWTGGGLVIAGMLLIGMPIRSIDSAASGKKHGGLIKEEVLRDNV